MNRRAFLQSPAAAAIPAMQAPSDRVGVALIGCGGMGRANLVDFQKQPDVEIRALCDVFRPSAEAALKLASGKPGLYSDYRRILDRKDIDAVIVATPDHWHPLIAIHACQAGKDVYVEKPVSHNVREGRLMVEAARRHNRVVQVGIQQRSGAHFRRAAQAVRDGKIGKVLFAQCWNHNYSASTAGMGRPADSPAPKGLDWDMWLGPAPEIPYNPARRNFRAFWDYAGGELTNWCVHLIDFVHMALDVDTPLTVASSGGKWFYDDIRDCADTQEVVWEYPGNLLVRYSTLVHNSYGPNGHPGNKSFGSYGAILQGTLGTLFIDRAGYEVTPQMEMHAEEHSAGSSAAYDDLIGFGQFFTTLTTPERGATSFQHLPHVRNFLDCIKSRERPAGDIEIGHRSTATCLLGNIALRTGEKLKWDAAAERFTNGSPEANALLRRDYRPPWSLPGL
ncbi:MAG: Gfo/Idh/MocA family oxidoreductase [Candidatus Solibacter usitatus]|nr:Gfo/Idh/MocA family oxidoreductase [Candidatus Solibacter usitatus]